MTKAEKTQKDYKLQADWASKRDSKRALKKSARKLIISGKVVPRNLRKAIAMCG